MRRTLVAAIALCAACSGRGESEQPEPPPVVCTMEARAALVVRPVDDATGIPVRGATVRAISDGFSENLSEFDGSYSGAHERAGTYTVVISHPDYRQWQRAGIVVEEDECHVSTQAVQARLARRSS